MILVDTSVWIEFFKGKKIASEVDRLLDDNLAALCGPILTELLRGIRTEKDRGAVIPLLQGCRFLEQPQLLWEEAGTLGFHLRAKGIVVKTMDLLITTYAVAHRTPILTLDSDFSKIRKAGIPIELV